MRRILLRFAGLPSWHRLRRTPGVGPVLMWLLGRAIGGRETITIRIDEGPLSGVDFELDPRVQGELLQGRYELHVQEAIWDALRAGDVAFDVGSHYGYFALVMASRVGSDGRVVCFEPDPQAREVLRRNLERNRMSFDERITAVGAAVGASPGRLRFEPGSHSTRGRLSDRGDVDVEVTTVDDAVERFGRPMAVKVDVEGGELDVLRGASGLLAADSTTFVLEIHSNEAGRDCRRLLENQGYECLEVDEPGRAETHLIARPARGT